MKALSIGTALLLVTTPHVPPRAPRVQLSTPPHAALLCCSSFRHFILRTGATAPWPWACHCHQGNPEM